ncbi:MAG: hypothetical protein WD844_13100 [Thermoleophilaceae bacterium]
MEASSARRGSYLDLSRLSRGEIFGMAAALVLVASLFLPWFSTSDTNEFSLINGEQGQFNAFETFSTLQWWLIAAATAPFILAWIIARGHKLTWNPGEVTMIVGVTAAVLILLNGVVLGKPGDSVEIGFEIGYLVAMLAALGIGVGGYLRQAGYIRGRKPPGSL